MCNRDDDPTQHDIGREEKMDTADPRGEMLTAAEIEAGDLDLAVAEGRVIYDEYEYPIGVRREMTDEEASAAIDRLFPEEPLPIAVRLETAEADAILWAYHALGDLTSIRPDIRPALIRAVLRIARATLDTRADGADGELLEAAKARAFVRASMLGGRS